MTQRCFPSTVQKKKHKEAFHFSGVMGSISNLNHFSKIDMFKKKRIRIPRKIYLSLTKIQIIFNKKQKLKNNTQCWMTQVKMYLLLVGINDIICS